MGGRVDRSKGGGGVHNGGGGWDVNFLFLAWVFILSKCVVLKDC